ALVQEFIPTEEGRITRVEVLGGRFLYAIRVYSSGDTFNLCPADVCQTTDGAELVRSACPVDAPRNGLRVEGYEPPAEIARQVERIAAACGIERSEEHTSELQSRVDLVCRLLLEKKKERREKIDRAGAESLLPGNNRVDVPKDILDQNRRHQAELAKQDRKSTLQNFRHQQNNHAV